MREKERGQVVKGSVLSIDKSGWRLLNFRRRSGEASEYGQDGLLPLIFVCGQKPDSTQCTRRSSGGRCARAGNADGAHLDCAPITVRNQNALGLFHRLVKYGKNASYRY